MPGPPSMQRWDFGLACLMCAQLQGCGFELLNGVFVGEACLNIFAWFCLVCLMFAVLGVCMCDYWAVGELQFRCQGKVRGGDGVCLCSWVQWLYGLGFNLCFQRCDVFGGQDVV